MIITETQTHTHTHIYLSLRLNSIVYCNRRDKNRHHMTTDLKENQKNKIKSSMR